MQPAIVVVRPGRREGNGAVSGVAPLEAGLVDGILRIDVMRAKGVGAVRERPVRALADGMGAGPSRGAAWIWVGGAAPADAVAYVIGAVWTDPPPKDELQNPLLPTAMSTVPWEAWASPGGPTPKT